MKTSKNDDAGRQDAVKAHREESIRIEEAKRSMRKKADALIARAEYVTDARTLPYAASVGPYVSPRRTWFGLKRVEGSEVHLVHAWPLNTRRSQSFTLVLIREEEANTWSLARALRGEKRFIGNTQYAVVQKLSNADLEKIVMGHPEGYGYEDIEFAINDVISSIR